MSDIKKKGPGLPKGRSLGAKPIYSDTIREKKLDKDEQQQYIKDKMKVLKDFCIQLTPEQKRELKCLTDPLSIDVYVRRLIAKRLGVEY